MATTVPPVGWTAPRDSPRVSARALGELVAALGGGAAAAWAVRTCIVAADLPPDMTPNLWLEVVMFVSTALLTRLAVRRALPNSLWLAPWICSFYGAVNGVVCWLLLAPVLSGTSSALVAAFFGSIPAAMIGWGFGLAFGVGYLPILALAKRGLAEPSHDVLTRMVPWATAWLSVTALVVGFTPSLPRQELFAIACAALSFGLALFALRADARRELFLDSLTKGALPKLRLSRSLSSRAPEAALPLVGGSLVGAALVEAHSVGAGPFRAAEADKTHATLSAEARDERFALSARRVFCWAVLVTDAALLGGLAALVAFA